MLFTRDTRVVLVSASAEKFLGRPAAKFWDVPRKKSFPMNRLGAVVLPAFQKQRALVQYEFETVDGRRVQVSSISYRRKARPSALC